MINETGTEVPGTNPNETTPSPKIAQTAELNIDQTASTGGLLSWIRNMLPGGNRQKATAEPILQSEQLAATNTELETPPLTPTGDLHEHLGPTPTATPSETETPAATPTITPTGTDHVTDTPIDQTDKKAA